jgi:hypothetical protein
MEYFAGASDQTIWESGLSRAGYARALQQQERTRRLEEHRAANTATVEQRSGSRFYEGGQPITKVGWKRELDAQRESEIQRQYTAWKKAGEFSTPEGRDIAAALGNYLGATRATGQAFSEWLRSESTAAKYSTKQ